MPARRAPDQNPAILVGGSGYAVTVAESPRHDFPNHFVGDLVPTDRGWVCGATNQLPQRA
jgi:hypothetical protein